MCLFNFISGSHPANSLEFGKSVRLWRNLFSESLEDLALSTKGTFVCLNYRDNLLKMGVLGRRILFSPCLEVEKS